MCLPNRRDSRGFGPTALWVGAGVGVTRAALASLGWYVVEHTGGALQSPAFALAMLAWPEAAMLTTSRVTPAPGVFYVFLSLLLISTTVVFAAVVAIAAGLLESRRGGTSTR